MEISHIRSLVDFGMDDPSYAPLWQFNSLDELSAVSATDSFEENLQHSFAHQMFDVKPSPETPHTATHRPLKIQKTNSWDSSKTDLGSNPQANSSSNLVSFANSPNYANQFGIIKPKEDTQDSFGNQNYVLKASQGVKRISTNTRHPSNQDHVMAERKRREKLSQRFIALSAIIPGLKKVDKASVLGDAIKYLKQLQERVKTLEEQARKKSTESVVLVRKYEVYADGENSSSGENSSGGTYDEPLPEIEARFCDKNVLIRIHCERTKGVVEKTVAEIEKLHLSIINSSVMAFGTSALDITIVAQMDAEFTMSMQDLVKNLRAALKLFT